MKENNKNINKEYDSPIEAILDENNTDNIILYDENGTETEFEQIAVVPLPEKICVILKPVATIPGIKENEALVFVIDEVDDTEILYVATDDELIDEVFTQYYKMLEEAGIDIY